MIIKSFRVFKKIHFIILLYISLSFTFFLYSFDFKKEIKDLENNLLIFFEIPVYLKTNIYEHKKFKKYIEKTFHAIKYKFSNQKFNNYAKIKIDINFKNLEKLKKSRTEAIQKKFNNFPEEVDANIIFNEKEYPAKIRLNGYLYPNWENKKQWGLKIKLKNDQTINSLNEFTISNFHERDYPYNFIFKEIYKKYGLIVFDQFISNIIVNGDKWGLMLIEEKISDHFFFRNTLKESLTLKPSNSEDFRLSIYNENIRILDNLQDLIKWQSKFEETIYNERKIINSSNIDHLHTNLNLLTFFRNIREDIILKKISKQNLINNLDIESFAKAAAINSFFGDTHSSTAINTRYYINPYDLKIYPIYTDFIHGDIKDKIYFDSVFGKILIQNDEFQKIFFKILNELYRDKDLIFNLVKNICKDFGQICLDRYNFNQKINNYNRISQNSLNYFKNGRNTQEKDSFDTKKNNELIRNKIYFRAFDDGKLKLYNLTSEKILISKILLKKNNKLIKSIYKNQNLEKSNFLKPNIAFIDLDEIIHPKDLVEIHYFDEFNKKQIISNYVESKKYFDNYYSNFLDHSNFIHLEGKTFIIKSGNHIVSKPILIPSHYNLYIENDVNLLMKENTFIKVSNGSLTLDGTKNNPIIIKSYDSKKKWHGIYVNYVSSDNKKNLINIKNSNLSNLTYYDDGKIQLSGSINFINSNVKIKNLKLTENSSEDAINIINSFFEIDSLIIKNTSSDAIDLDFSSGEIKNAFFENINGDAIDFSKSNTYLENIKSNNVYDKTISAGEQSKIDIKILTSNFSGIAIASKDSSLVKARKVFVSNCRNYDFAVYRKKNIFNDSKMQINETINCNKSIVQENNLLIIDGKKLEATKFNSKELLY